VLCFLNFIAAYHVDMVSDQPILSWIVWVGCMSEKSLNYTEKHCDLYRGKEIIKFGLIDWNYDLSLGSDEWSWDDNIIYRIINVWLIDWVIDWVIEEIGMIDDMTECIDDDVSWIWKYQIRAVVGWPSALFVCWGYFWQNNIDQVNSLLRKNRGGGGSEL